MRKYIRKTLVRGTQIGLKDNFWYVWVPDSELEHSVMVVHKPDIGQSLGYMVISKGTKPVIKKLMKGSSGYPDQWGEYFRFMPYKRKTIDVPTNVLGNTIGGMPEEYKKQWKEKLGL